MTTNLSAPSAGKKTRDLGRYIGGWIYLIIGCALLLFVTLNAPIVEEIYKKADKTKVLWCFGWASIGFAFNAFIAADKAKSTKSAWPLYLWFYFPLLCLIAGFAYCGVEVYTVEISIFFYPLAALLSLALGFHSDRLVNTPFGFIPGKN